MITKDNRKNIFLLLSIFIFLVFTLNSVSSLLDETQTQTNVNTGNGIEVDYPKFDKVRENQPFNLTIFTYNITDGRNLYGSNCSLQLFNNNGQGVYNVANLSSFGRGYNNFLSSGNFTINGIYSFEIYCENQNIGGFASGIFEITPSGKVGNSNIAFFFIIIILSYAISILGFYQKNEWIVVLGGMLLIGLGIYMIRNGIIDYRDWYTNYLSYVTLGYGAITSLLGLISIIEDNL